MSTSGTVALSFRSLALAAGLLFLLGCTTGQMGAPAPAQTAAITAVESHEKTGVATEAPQGDPFYDARQKMVDVTIEARGVEDPDILMAMRNTPRHEFVLEKYLAQAYADHPLPIGYGQTISQPYIVAWMTELLELQPGDRVLEIGTGSGYQAAVLAELGSVEVFSIEIVPELAAAAAERLARLGYAVQTKQGDGYYGWEEYAPFDAIIVTAAPDHLPAPLVAQLADGGRLVLPIGPPGGYQSLWQFVKQGDDLKGYNMGGVSFVPFTGAGIQGGEGTETPTP
ncbi:MAG: protein-L-isoaspartate(D-aspartate) O-methyltransferase [Anaerolineales bacterium]|nr:protein-L-isoaspartate(D-aspartate) O-methyltransferase [Anaerolineales bacterium]